MKKLTKEKIEKLEEISDDSGQEIVAMESVSKTTMKGIFLVDKINEIIDVLNKEK